MNLKSSYKRHIKYIFVFYNCVQFLATYSHTTTFLKKSKPSSKMLQKQSIYFAETVGFGHETSSSLCSEQKVSRPLFKSHIRHAGVELPFPQFYCVIIAETVGFEPTVGLLLRLFSRQLPSTTQPRFHARIVYIGVMV